MLKTFKQKTKMDPNSKTSRILKTIYLAKRKIGSEEISKRSKVDRKQITPFTKKLPGLVKKEKINGKCYYWIPESEIKYVRKILSKAFGDIEDEKRME